MVNNPKQKQQPVDISQLLYDVHNFGINTESREIFLINSNSDNSSDDGGIDYRVAINFLKNLSILEQFGRSKITVYLHTIGGSWFDGMAIYNAIRAAKSQVNMVVHASAESMGSVVFQAAKQRIMMPDSYLMLHHGSVGFESMASQAASEFVKFNNAGCKKMLSIFADRAVNTSTFFGSKRWGSARIAEYLDQEIRKRGDWYISAQEAVDYGLADLILESGKNNG